MSTDPLSHVAAGNNRVAERDSVAVMAGEEQARRRGLDLAHPFSISAVAQVVLRDGARIKDAVRESGLPFHSKENAQVIACKSDQLPEGRRGELRIPLTAYVAGENEV